MRVRDFIIVALGTLPFMGLEMSPLSGSWEVSFVVWGIWLTLLLRYLHFPHDFVRRLRVRWPITLSGTQLPTVVVVPNVAIGETASTRRWPEWLDKIASEDQTNPTSRVPITGIRWQIVPNVSSGYHYIEFCYEGVNGTIFSLYIDQVVTGRALCGNNELGDTPEITDPDVSKNEVKRGARFVFTLRQKLTGEMLVRLMQHASERVTFSFEKVSLKFRLEVDHVKIFPLAIPKTLVIPLPANLADSENYHPGLQKLDY